MGIFLCLSKKKRRAYALNDRERMEMLDSKDTTAQWPGRKKKKQHIFKWENNGRFLPWRLLDNHWSRGHWELKDTDFRQSGMFSNILYIPYANAQATAMEIHLTWDLGLILSMKKGDQFKSHSISCSFIDLSAFFFLWTNLKIKDENQWWETEK